MKVHDAHILAVLDQEETSKQMGALLQSASTHVTLSDSFSKAIEILRLEKIDVLITDIKLQDDDSDLGSFFDFLRWVKGDPLLRSVPVICISLEPIMSQTNIDGLRIAARSLGAARFLTMEHFDGSLLLEEIDCLIPKEKI